MRIPTIAFLLLISPSFLPLAFARAQQGFFRVEQRDGVWWVIDPDGKPGLSIGIDHIAWEADKIKGTGPAPYREAVEKTYPDRNAWGLMALARMRLWGFNTIGAWSDEDLWEHKVPYTIILDIASQAGADWQHGKPVDVYDPKFETAALEIAAKDCAPRANDRWLLGYFTDNELRWGRDWRGKESMLEMYLMLPEGAGGRAKAIEFLRQRYGGEVAKLNSAWGIKAKDFAGAAAPLVDNDAFQSDVNAFLEQVAARYFEICANAIRAADPNHMILGARFAGRVPDAVVRGAKVCDVVSVNIYAFDPRPLVLRVAELSGRPVLIGEFAFRAEDSGLPNTRGAGPKVANQLARARAFTDYVTWLLSVPEAVGYHWFEWVDEPKEGRFDGEDSNYGLVNIQDQPYDEFVTVVKAVNETALGVHRLAAKSP
jgi:agarase